MEKMTFSKKELVWFGWKTAKEHLKFFILLLFLVFLIINVPAFTSGYLKKSQPVMSAVFKVVAYVLQFILTMGMMRIALKFCDKQKPGFDELFSCAKLFPRYFFASLLFGLLVMSGGIALIIPGFFMSTGVREIWFVLVISLWVIPAVVLSLKFGFYVYLIVDRDMKIIESLKTSARITQGVKWQIFLFHAMVSFFVLAGILTVMVAFFGPGILLALCATGKLLFLSGGLRSAAAMGSLIFIVSGIIAFVFALGYLFPMSMVSYAALYRKVSSRA